MRKAIGNWMEMAVKVSAIDSVCDVTNVKKEDEAKSLENKRQNALNRQ